MIDCLRTARRHGWPLFLVLIAALLSACAPAQNRAAEIKINVSNTTDMYQRGLYSMAIAKAQNDLQQNPDHYMTYESWRTIADCRSARGEIESAAEAWKQVLSAACWDKTCIGDGKAWSLLKLGNLSHDPEQAIDNYTNALAENSIGVNDSPYLQRGYAKLRLGRFREALLDVQRYAMVKEAARDKFAAKNQYIGWFSYSQWRQLRGEAFARLALGQADRARALLEKAAALPGTNYSTAGDDLALLTLLDPEAGQPLVQNYLGAVFDHRPLERELKQQVVVVSVVPGSPAERAGLPPGSLVRTVAGQPVAEVVDLNRIISSLPAGLELPMTVSLEGESRNLTIKRGDTPELRAALTQTPLLAAILSHRQRKQEALAAEQQGEKRRALELYRTITAAGGLDTDTLSRVIQLTRRLDPPPAIPDAARKQAVFGQMALQQAQDENGLDRAISEYLRAIGLAPWWADLYVNTALVMEKSGRYDDALEMLNLYLVAAPEAPDASQVQTKIWELEFKVKQTKP